MVICSNSVIHITFAARKDIFCILIHTVRMQTTVSLYSSSPESHQIGRVFIMLLYPPLNEVEEGYTGCTLSVFPSVSALFSTCYSPHYGWDAENWECGDILRVISVLWLKCGYNAEISPHSCQNTPIRIFYTFPSHFFHIRMQRFLRFPVRILPSAFFSI